MRPFVIQGLYLFLETNFQDFFKTHIYFARTTKCTIIEAANPYKIEVQKLIL